MVYEGFGEQVHVGGVDVVVDVVAHAVVEPSGGAGEHGAHPAQQSRQLGRLIVTLEASQGPQTPSGNYCKIGRDGIGVVEPGDDLLGVHGVEHRLAQVGRQRIQAAQSQHGLPDPIAVEALDCGRVERGDQRRDAALQVAAGDLFDPAVDEQPQHVHQVGSGVVKHWMPGVQAGQLEAGSGRLLELGQLLGRRRHQAVCQCPGSGCLSQGMLGKAEVQAHAMVASRSWVTSLRAGSPADHRRISSIT